MVCVCVSYDVERDRQRWIMWGVPAWTNSLHTTTLPHLRLVANTLTLTHSHTHTQSLAQLSKPHIAISKVTVQLHV